MYSFLSCRLLDGTICIDIMLSSVNWRLRMRIIAGAAKGRRLKSPQGIKVRPTSDLLREAIFSMLESLAYDWAHVVDFYAGTGALGIEALSRGSELVDFVERSPKLCALIQYNIEQTGLANLGKVYCMTAAKALTVLNKEYDIVLLDPPYNYSSITDITETLCTSSLIKSSSTLVVEHSRHISLNDTYSDFHIVKNLKHGDSRVTVYQHMEKES